MNLVDIENAANTLRGSCASKEAWEELIRIAQSDSYEACKCLVESAGKDEVSKRYVREIAFAGLEGAARAGDKEAWNAFRAYAEMAQDAELLARFSTEFVPANEKIGQSPTGELASILVEHGIDPASATFVAGAKIIFRFD